MLSTFFERDPAAVNDRLIIDDISKSLDRQESERRFRINSGLPIPPQTLNDGLGSWETVVDYEDLNGDFHDQIVLTEFARTINRRHLPFAVYPGGYLVHETLYYDIDCEAAHVAQTFTLGMMALHNTGLVKITRYNPDFVGGAEL